MPRGTWTGLEAADPTEEDRDDMADRGGKDVVAGDGTGPVGASGVRGSWCVRRFGASDIPRHAAGRSVRLPTWLARRRQYANSPSAAGNESGDDDDEREQRRVRFPSSATNENPHRRFSEMAEMARSSRSYRQNRAEKTTGDARGKVTACSPWFVRGRKARNVKSEPSFEPRTKNKVLEDWDEFR